MNYCVLLLYAKGAEKATSVYVNYLEVNHDEAVDTLFTRAHLSQTWSSQQPPTCS